MHDLRAISESVLEPCENPTNKAERPLLLTVSGASAHSIRGRGEGGPGAAGLNVGDLETTGPSSDPSLLLVLYPDTALS
jgi:hypothetical protein